ncbi:hypothetical protein, partial [Bradyrhizobium sp. 18]
ADGDIPPADVPDGLLLGDANGQANGADVPPFQVLSLLASCALPTTLSEKRKDWRSYFAADAMGKISYNNS